MRLAYMTIDAGTGELDQEKKSEQSNGCSASKLVFACQKRFGVIMRIQHNRFMKSNRTS